jgi:imidazole glycerol-phosphate synthase subunit HisH
LKKVAIVDYGSGNLFSVAQAIKKIGARPVLASSEEDINDCDSIILPGVGAFNNAMQSLNETGLIPGIIDSVKNGKPILGICLGMQLLFETSNEFGFHEGLKLLNGDVVRFSNLDEGTAIPQIQWNRIQVNIKKMVLFQDLHLNPFMYFLHSYYVNPCQRYKTIFKSSYGGLNYCSAIEHGNIYGVQFHPERSSTAGLRLLKNFVELA